MVTMLAMAVMVLPVAEITAIVAAMVMLAVPVVIVVAIAAAIMAVMVAVVVKPVAVAGGAFSWSSASPSPRGP
jgi:hypothetical protein